MPTWSDGVPFAVDAQGRFRDIADVPRGLACECFCAACRGRVVAKKGEINAHYFAHHDRRECRNALEASLFGMLMTLVKEPSTRLLVPPAGNREDLVPHPEQIFTDAQRTAFFKTAWVIAPRQIALQGATIATDTLAGSTLEHPDIILPELSIHFASHVKPMRELARLHVSSDRAVLAIDLQSYVKLWWESCDADKGERLQHALTATDSMRRWLESHATGRRWLYHPELEQKKEELRIWIRDKSVVAAEWRKQQAMLLIPESLGSVSDANTGAKPVGCLRRLEECPWMSFRLAAEFGLYWDQRSRRYFAFGQPGTSVSPTVGKYLDVADDWRPITAAELAELKKCAFGPQ